MWVCSASNGRTCRKEREGQSLRGRRKRRTILKSEQKNEEQGPFPHTLSLLSFRCAPRTLYVSTPSTSPHPTSPTMAQRSAHVSHAWHDISIGEEAPDIFNAVIEIPRGSKVKYELDKVRESREEIWNVLEWPQGQGASARSGRSTCASAWAARDVWWCPGRGGVCPELAPGAH